MIHYRVASVVCAALLAGISSVGCASQSRQQTAHTDWTDIRSTLAITTPDRREIEPLIRQAWERKETQRVCAKARVELADCQWKAAILQFNIGAGWMSDKHQLFDTTGMGGVAQSPVITFIGGTGSTLHLVSNQTFYSFSDLKPHAVFDFSMNSRVVSDLSMPLSHRLQPMIERLIHSPSATEPRTLEAFSMDGCTFYGLLLWTPAGTSTWVSINYHPDDSYTHQFDDKDVLLERLHAFGSLYVEAWKAFSEMPDETENAALNELDGTR